MIFLSSFWKENNDCSLFEFLEVELIMNHTIKFWNVNEVYTLSECLNNNDLWLKNFNEIMWKIKFTFKYIFLNTFFVSRDNLIYYSNAF